MIGVIGTTGYHFIEGFSLIDALYMTVITVSTVGFREVHDLSVTGKLFTIFLIVISLGTFAYAISTFTSLIIEGRLLSILKGYRTKSVLKMENHIIVVGYGRNGQQVVKELLPHKHHILVIDLNKDISNRQVDKNVHFIAGDATNDLVLMNAGIKKAKALITSLPLDADNLFVVLSARSLNPGITIISRATDESSEKKLLKEIQRSRKIKLLFSKKLYI